MDILAAVTLFLIIDLLIITPIFVILYFWLVRLYKKVEQDNYKLRQEKRELEAQIKQFFQVSASKL